MANKIALFFGSFNPIHIGHLAIANYVVEFTDIKQVWFVVSPHNPLKNKTSLLADHHRLALVRAAIEYDLRFKATDVEFHMPQPSYTIDTLAYLQEKYPENDFVKTPNGCKVFTVAGIYPGLREANQLPDTLSNVSLDRDNGLTQIPDIP